MAIFSHEHLAFLFGFFGNFISFLVYFAPLMTFYKIYRRGLTANFHAIPYSVALFSATLMLYYAHLKGNEIMLITINAFGCGIETAYLIVFFIYANAKARTKAAQLVTVFNVGVYGLIILFTSLVAPASQRVKMVRWISAIFSVCVFAAPLSIMRHVIKTKSVEFLPFPLSVCLTLSAIFWFCYGIFTKDLFVATPNTLGFLFGIAQIVLYFIYKNAKKDGVNATEKQNNVVNLKERDEAELENGEDNTQQQENANANAGNNSESTHVQNESHCGESLLTINVAHENLGLMETPTMGNYESKSIKKAALAHAPAAMQPSINNV